jgi:hypothetical protein
VRKGISSWSFCLLFLSTVKAMIIHGTVVGRRSIENKSDLDVATQKRKKKGVNRRSSASRLRSRARSARFSRSSSRRVPALRLCSRSACAFLRPFSRRKLCFITAISCTVSAPALFSRQPDRPAAPSQRAPPGRTTRIEELILDGAPLPAFHTLHLF